MKKKRFSLVWADKFRELLRKNASDSQTVQDFLEYCDSMEEALNNRIEQDHQEWKKNLRRIAK